MSKEASTRTCRLVLGILVGLHAAGPSPSAKAAPEAAMPGGMPESTLPIPLRVASLNIAHGRRSSLNQVLLGEETIRNNLQGVARLLTRTSPAVVALQEADGPSRWSGNFDHVALLAAAAGYTWRVHAPHAQTWLYAYGTALLSRAPFVEVLRHDFESTPPTTTKGFIVAQVTLALDHESRSTIDVDLVSVHLDFSRAAVRERQVDEMNRVLAGRRHPLIVLGDFNSDWASDPSAVRRFAELRGLHAYRPDAEDLGTYDGGSERLDWILLSAELEFTRYEVLPDVVSDHLIVVAEIGLRPGPSPTRLLPREGVQ